MCIKLGYIISASWGRWGEDTILIFTLLLTLARGEILLQGFIILGGELILSEALSVG